MADSRVIQIYSTSFLTSQDPGVVERMKIPSFFVVLLKVDHILLVLRVQHRGRQWTGLGRVRVGPFANARPVNDLGMVGLFI